MDKHIPLILITNDDAIDAPGMDVLIRLASRYGKVITVAPAFPQSGKSSALTVDMPLHISQKPDLHGAEVYTVNGTPVDCVKLALDAILSRKPDLLLSGINHGSNSGNAVTYSGTMGAVIEGCTVGIPSVGFSLCHHSLKADFSLSEKFVDQVIAKVLKEGLPDFTALNINIPARVVPQGLKVCRAARGHWSEEYKRYLDPHGRPFYLLTGRFINEEPDAPDTDEYWLSQNYISVVPVTPDQTAFDQMDTIRVTFN